MKPYVSKSGQIFAEIKVINRICAYDLEATIGELLFEGKVVKNRNQVLNRLKENLSVFGPDHCAYFWERNERDILPACILISKKFFPEFYKN